MLVSPGSYRIVADLDQWPAEVTLDVKAGDTKTLELRLK